MNHFRGHLMTIALSLVVFGPSVRAADDIRTERVQFAKGASSAVVEGTITGYETVDYLLGAAAGQHANISMATKNGATYFNILAPGETEVAFFIGSVSGNQYEGTLPATGDYKVRVYMMRSAARRNEKAGYRLEMVVTGKPHASSSRIPMATSARSSSLADKPPGRTPARTGMTFNPACNARKTST